MKKPFKYTYIVGIILVVFYEEKYNEQLLITDKTKYFKYVQIKLNISKKSNIFIIVRR